MANDKKKQTPNSTTMNSDEILRLIKIILILVVIVVVFYIITIVITKYQKDSTEPNYNDTTPAIIQYDEIVLGTLLKQSREEYYVLIKGEKEPYEELFSSYIKTYSSKAKSLKVYTANLDDVFNQFYVSETSYLKTKNISEFRVSGISLVKVKNHEVVEAYEGIDEIETAFKALVK